MPINRQAPWAMWRELWKRGATASRSANWVIPCIGTSNGGYSDSGAGSFSRCLCIPPRAPPVLDVVEDEGSNDLDKRVSLPSMSLAKSLAFLAVDSATPSSNRRPWIRMEQKRGMELRIKKRVKAQFSDGRYHELMSEVVANADTLRDSYDILRLNSNVGLSPERDGLCFASLAEEVSIGRFDLAANSVRIGSRDVRKEHLVLPRLKLRVLQEAMRVVLEVVYRPHFSKISHGCRSARGHRSALKYVREGINKPDNWWFTLNLNKDADDDVVCKLLSLMEEKIEDPKLLSFIRDMFDAAVVNLTFGRFPKGYGLPQEGALSPILMNIYLDSLDRELFGISMRYEVLEFNKVTVDDGCKRSNLRKWVRRQIKGGDSRDEEPSQRICACRYMDEVFVSVSGSEAAALEVMHEIRGFLKNSLHLDSDENCRLFATNDNPHGMQFLGAVVRVMTKENTATRAVHKLKDKVRLFASQKQEIWDAGTARIGKKWLGYGLRRIKESEIKQLNLSTPMLDHISQFRKAGMETDHWFKSLLKIWMQDVNTRVETNEEAVLSKFIVEPAMPPELRDSFYNFQKIAKEYVSSETSVLALLSTSDAKGVSHITEAKVAKIEALVGFIERSLIRYGLITSDGFARHVSILILHHNMHIISWFSGLVARWLKWYSEFDNFGDIKLMVTKYCRKSCIRTLAAKHRMHETLIEKKFESELSAIPVSEELENEASSELFICTRDDDGSLAYGISHSGQCLLSLSSVKVPPTRMLRCFVVGCSSSSPSMYSLHVKEISRLENGIFAYDSPQFTWEKDWPVQSACQGSVYGKYFAPIRRVWVFAEVIPGFIWEIFWQLLQMRRVEDLF